MTGGGGGMHAHVGGGVDFRDTGPARPVGVLGQTQQDMRWGAGGASGAVVVGGGAVIYPAAPTY